MDARFQQQNNRYNQLFRARDSLYRQVALKSGLSEMTFWVMYILCMEKTPQSQSDICRDWFYPKQTVNSAIAKLQRMGYLTLEPDGARRKVLQITEAGQAYCDKWVTPVLAADDQSFAALTDLERETYLSLMQREFDRFQAVLKPILDR